MQHLFRIAVPTLLLLLLAACGSQTDSDDAAASSSMAVSSAASASTAAYVGPGCKVGGCSAQLCVNENDADVVSTCEWTAVYACFQTARCEVQDGGDCGWTQTDALTACLESAR